MPNLIRFDNWIFDRDLIVVVELVEDKEDTANKQIINEKHSINDSRHGVKITLKDERSFILWCNDKYNAEYELNFLTATINPDHIQNNYQHWLCRAFRQHDKETEELIKEVKKLMKQFAKLKEKKKNAK